LNARPTPPNRRTTPRSYYEIFVHPNFEDYLAHRSDIRFAFNACVPAFQLADVMFEYYGVKNLPSKLSKCTTTTKLHKRLTRIEPAFLTIQSIATAYKHLHPKGSFYEIGSPMALWGLTLPADNLNLSSMGTERLLEDVIVRRKRGPDVSLTKALTSVVESMWPSILPAV
jgi:hypothetical protein